MYVTIDFLPQQESLQFYMGCQKRFVYSLQLGSFCDTLRQVCPAEDIHAWGGAQAHLAHKRISATVLVLLIRGTVCAASRGLFRDRDI